MSDAVAAVVHADVASMWDALMFRRRWTFGVGSGARILANDLRDVTRERAEAQGGHLP